LQQTSKSFSTFFSKPDVEKPGPKTRPSFPAKLPVSKTVSSILSSKNLDSDQRPTIFQPTTSAAIANVQKIGSDKIFNPEQGSAKLTATTSVNSVVSKAQNSDKFVEQSCRPNLQASKSLSAASFSQKNGAKSDSHRSTLGVARRSSAGPLTTLNGDNGDRTPEMKRARLNFNPPTFHSGRRIGQSCVAQQYFGNVPLQF